MFIHMNIHSNPFLNSKILINITFPQSQSISPKRLTLKPAKVIGAGLGGMQTMISFKKAGRKVT